MEYLGSLKNTVVNALSGTTASPTVTKSDVLGLEEGERSRRMTQTSQTQVDKENAANVSGLITRTRFPVFRGNVSKGYKRVTTRYEEDERRRRLTNKSESALRRANANKTSRMIQEMGWPFYQQNHLGAEYLVMDPTKLLEEEEREWRTSDSYWGPTAKHNAAMVANILRWGNFQLNPHSGFRQHVKHLEEKERKDRINNTESAMQNAYKEAGLIKKMGAPFYVQEPLSSKRDFSEINKLEELERERRIEHPEERQLARELAGVVKSEQGLHPIHDSESEEQERRRRIADKKAQKIAKQNAKQVSLMVRESSQNKINGTAPMWFSISRNSMKALEEVERTRRLRDIEGQRFAKQHAKTISGLISGRTLAASKPSINAIEEEERQARMHDRQSQQIQIKNARKVSGLIARHVLMSSGSKDFALALEESERARRISDSNQQALAKDNARKVSNLVSSLNVAPGNKMAALASPTAALPTYSAPVAASPTKVDIPLQKDTPRSIAPLVASPLVQQQPLRSSAEIKPTSPLVASVPKAAPIAPSIAPIPSAPISSAPISSAPISSAPISSAPISSAPISSAPISSAPISSAPISSAPISSAPLTSAHIPSAPISSAPISSAPISSAPISSAPISSAPISSTPISSAPISAPISAPVSSAPIAAAASRSAPLSSSPSIQPMVLPTTSAPVPVAPLATASSLPVPMPVRSSTPTSSFSSSPMSSAPLSSSPSYAPFSSAPVSSVPLSSSPMYSAPLSSTPISSMPLSSAPITSAPIMSTPITTIPAVPVDSAALARPALGDRERKRLLKQAERHNRRSEKDVRKAEASMLRAEKMHQKGKDSKALKLEGKAERFMKEAEHERRWASGLQSELAPNAPAPASM